MVGRKTQNISSHDDVNLIISKICLYLSTLKSYLHLVRCVNTNRLCWSTCSASPCLPLSGAPIESSGGSSAPWLQRPPPRWGFPLPARQHRPGGLGPRCPGGWSAPPCSPEDRKQQTHYQFRWSHSHHQTFSSRFNLLSKSISINHLSTLLYSESKLCYSLSRVSHSKMVYQGNIKVDYCCKSHS